LRWESDGERERERERWAEGCLLGAYQIAPPPTSAIVQILEQSAHPSSCGRPADQESRKMWSSCVLNPSRQLLVVCSVCWSPFPVYCSFLWLFLWDQIRSDRLVWCCGWRERVLSYICK
jgi:hypothetical protein